MTSRFRLDRARLLHGAELVAAIATWDLTRVLTSRHQAPISVHQGRGWDGEVYHEVAVQLFEHGTAQGGAPFAARAGTGIVSNVVRRLFHLPHERAFIVTNAVASLLLVVLLLELLRLYVPLASLRWMGIAMFVTHWAGPVRLTFHQWFVDPLGMALVVLGLVIVERARRSPTTSQVFALALVSFAAAVVREITLVLPLAFVVAMFVAKGSRERRAVAAALPLLAWLAGAVTIRRFVWTVGSSYDAQAEAVRWLYDKPLPSIVHGLFLSFGLLPVLLLAYREEVIDLARAAPHLAFVGASFLVLGLVGGDSTERLMMYAMIPILVFAGNALSRDPRAMLGFPAVGAVVVAAFVGRVFWSIPDCPTPNAEPAEVVLVPIGRIEYDELWSTLLARGHRAEQWSSLLQLLFVAAVAYTFSRRSREAR